MGSINKFLSERDVKKPNNVYILFYLFFCFVSSFGVFFFCSIYYGFDNKLLSRKIKEKPYKFIIYLFNFFLPNMLWV